jgi:predicted esterase YcpF (UPF0227 family)
MWSFIVKLQAQLINWLFQTSIDEKRLETALQLLKNTVKNILNSRESYDCFETAYANVYNLVLHKCGSEVLAEVIDMIANFLIEKVTPSLLLLFCRFNTHKGYFYFL